MVELRDATPADAHAIAGVLVASWRAAYRGLIPDEVLAGLSVADRERFWAAGLTDPGIRAVVATLSGAVVGFAATGPPLVPADRADPTLGDLYACYLHPDVWRRGIGTRLHDAALDRLRDSGFTHAGLWVLDTNERAIRFYTHLGWTDTGRTQLDRGPGGVDLLERRLEGAQIGHGGARRAEAAPGGTAPASKYGPVRRRRRGTPRNHLDHDGHPPTLFARPLTR